MDNAAYDAFVALHVAAAVVGFGTVALSGVYGGNARRLEKESAAEELRRYFRAPGRLELVLLGVPVFGAAALALDPGGSGFGELWVDVGLGLWVVAAILLLGIVRPAEAVLRRALHAAEVPGDPAGDGLISDKELPAAGRRLQWAAAGTDLIFLVALIVMIIKPGS